MKSIRFSHAYEKFPPNPDPSILLEVFVVDDDLHKGFTDYDTQISGGGKYKLPTGKKLVLLLQTCEGLLWTTIRRHTPDKEPYYLGLRGQKMSIVITETNTSLDSYL